MNIKTIGSIPQKHINQIPSYSISLLWLEGNIANNINRFTFALPVIRLKESQAHIISAVQICFYKLHPHYRQIDILFCPKHKLN